MDIWMILALVFGAIILKMVFGGQKYNLPAPKKRRPREFFPNADKYRTLEEVQVALRTSGLESSNLIIGIDYTKSNTYTGKRSFGGKSLHYIPPREVCDQPYNPYQQVISIIGRTLEAFDDDKQIPVFGFGDETTTNRLVFPFYPDRPCYTFQEVLHRYNEITPSIRLSGPTSFAPLIEEAIRIVKETGTFHILVIIADGEVIDVDETKDAIVAASNYPLSIIMVGVGDGPFGLMEEFDDHLPRRSFDNFQFVDYNKVIDSASGQPSDVTFALHALMELPDQYQIIKNLRMV